MVIWVPLAILFSTLGAGVIAAASGGEEKKGEKGEKRPEPSVPPDPRDRIFVVRNGIWFYSSEWVPGLLANVFDHLYPTNAGNGFVVGDASRGDPPIGQSMGDWLRAAAATGQLVFVEQTLHLPAVSRFAWAGGMTPPQGYVGLIVPGTLVGRPGQFDPFAGQGQFTRLVGPGQFTPSPDPNAPKIPISVPGQSPGQLPAQGQSGAPAAPPQGQGVPIPGMPWFQVPPGFLPPGQAPPQGPPGAPTAPPQGQGVPIPGMPGFQVPPGFLPGFLSPGQAPPQGPPGAPAAPPQGQGQGVPIPGMPGFQVPPGFLPPGQAPPQGPPGAPAAPPQGQGQGVPIPGMPGFQVPPGMIPPGFQVPPGMIPPGFQVPGQAIHVPAGAGDNVYTIAKDDIPFLLSKRMTPDHNPNRWRELGGANPELGKLVTESGVTNYEHWEPGRVIRVPPGWNKNQA